MKSSALQAIEAFYGDRRAERSGVPLIRHIHEGLSVLEALQAPQGAKDAYCLHPLFQRDEDLAKNYGLFQQMPSDVIVNILEYRNQANAWLSDKVRPNPDAHAAERFVLEGRPSWGVIESVRQMLIADKVQNFKDFGLHHARTHARRGELELYFRTWLAALDVGPELHARLCGVMEALP